MTLTGPLEDDEAVRLLSWLKDWFDTALKASTGEADVGIFVQMQAGADFLLRHRFALRP
jgi:hypothetical protein